MSDTSSSARTRMMLDEIAAYSEAMLAAGDSFDGCGGLEDYESPAAWL